MQLPTSIIDPATAEPDKWNYVVALKDDDWDHWGTLASANKYLGARRAPGSWNLRDMHGSPVKWGYADDEIIVLECLK
ncbi:hypothetical protein [Gordonia sihwensis]|uniref:hypothetical protein n=1 Tax=Gordonia sihwensis TaxID=173559 RepID=UPI003D99D8B0